MSTARLAFAFVSALASAALSAQSAGPEVLFAKAVEGCDRIRVRSLAPNPDEPGRPLGFTVEGPEANRALRLFQFRGWFRCRCDGRELTLEFLAGERVLTTVDLRHTSSLGGSVWQEKEQAALTEASADALCDWLAQHGLVHDKLVRDGDKVRAEADAMTMRLRTAVLREAATACFAASDRNSLWRSLGADDRARGLQAVRLLGCHLRDWSAVDPWDDMLLSSLDEHRAVVPWQSIAEAAKTEERLALGLAAVFGAPGDGGCIPEPLRADLLLQVSAAGLMHPQPFQRRRMLQLLRDQPGAAATARLREVLAGSYPVKAASPVELGPAGGAGGWEGVDEVRDDLLASARALAASCLAARGDKESLPTILALGKSSSGRDRDVLTKAAVRLAALR